MTCYTTDTVPHVLGGMCGGFSREIDSWESDGGLRNTGGKWTHGGLVVATGLQETFIPDYNVTKNPFKAGFEISYTCLI